MYAVDCFQFQDDAAFDEQIEPELGFDALPSVNKWNIPLALDTKVLSLDFDNHAFTVNGL